MRSALRQVKDFIINHIKSRGGVWFCGALGRVWKLRVRMPVLCRLFEAMWLTSYSVQRNRKPVPATPTGEKGLWAPNRRPWWAHFWKQVVFLGFPAKYCLFLIFFSSFCRKGQLTDISKTPSSAPNLPTKLNDWASYCERPFCTSRVFWVKAALQTQWLRRQRDFLLGCEGTRETGRTAQLEVSTEHWMTAEWSLPPFVFSCTSWCILAQEQPADLQRSMRVLRKDQRCLYNHHRLGLGTNSVKKRA